MNYLFDILLDYVGLIVKEENVVVVNVMINFFVKEDHDRDNDEDVKEEGDVLFL